MLGAIIGDIVGSRFEWIRTKSPLFETFHPDCKYTDDSVMTCAVADCIMNNREPDVTLRQWGMNHPNSGYGGMFREWLMELRTGPYNSYGNGSAMRTSSVGWLFDDLDTVLEKAKFYADVTHNHPEGVKGAQSVSAAIFMARKGSTKQEIKEYIETTFGYDLSKTVDEIRPTYGFDETCQGSVPESIICFLESKDYIDCIKRLMIYYILVLMNCSGMYELDFLLYQ